MGGRGGREDREESTSFTPPLQFVAITNTSPGSSPAASATRTTMSW
jgi:hypothetical protein